MTARAGLLPRYVAELPTPALIVERSRLHENIAEMADRMAGYGVALRPHWKTSKSVEVARLQSEAGAVGFTVATAAELTALVEGGAEDVFWAYPPVGAPRVAAVMAAAAHARVIVSGDSVAALREVGQAAAACGRTIEYRLDVDTGLGRTGIAPDVAVERLGELSRLIGLSFEGVFTHEGQVQGVGADPELRAATGVAAGRLLAEVANEIRAAGFPVTSVSVGSTPGSWSAPTVPGITEARPGTYVFGDENQVAIGTIDAQNTALSVLTRVISTERDGTVLIDAGIKAFSSDGSLHGDGRIGTVVHGSGVVRTGHEEHGFLVGADGLHVGDLLRVRPNHACGAINMHSRVFVVDGDVVVDEWLVHARH